MSITEFKMALIRNLQAFEKLALENHARRAVMQNARPQHSDEPPLERQVADLLADPGAVEMVHRQFAPLYEQVERAAEEAELLDFLSRHPPAGEAN